MSNITDSTVRGAAAGLSKNEQRPVAMPSSTEFSSNKRYEVDILDGYGVVASWPLPVEPQE